MNETKRPAPGMVDRQKELQLNGMLLEILERRPPLSALERGLIERLTQEPPRRSLTACEAEWIERIHAGIKTGKGTDNAD